MLAKHENELEKISTEPILGFGSILCGQETDQYFFSSSGYILHLLRSPFNDTDSTTPPVVIEIYEGDGSFERTYAKRHGNTPAFSRRIPKEISKAEYIRLTRKPSFLVQPNTDYSRELAQLSFEKNRNFEFDLY